MVIKLHPFLRGIFYVLVLFLINSAFSYSFFSQTKNSHLNNNLDIETRSLDNQSFKEKAFSSNNTVILDVRTPREWKKGVISIHSKRINFYQNFFWTEIKQLPKNKTYFIYCHSGVRSLEVLKKMRQAELNAYHLKDGIKKWNDKIFYLD